MAKKRLNKKVAFVGFIIFIIFMLGATATFLYLSRNPEKYAKDGDVAFAAKDYETAVRCYLRARAYSKSDEYRVKMLFKLADVHMETDKWSNVLGCWNEIIRLDPKDIKSRYGRLKYFYTVADSGASKLWQDVDEQATQFIELVESEGLLNEDVNDWETFGLPASTIDTSTMGPYLYIVKGRALLEKAKRGRVTDPEELLSRSISDMEKALELDANSIDAYWYLAQAYIARGDIYASQGNLESKNKSLERAKELLDKSMQTTKSLQAHINRLAMEPIITQMDDKEQLKTLEPKYLKLVEEFSSDAKAHSSLAVFYAKLGHKSLDKATARITEAIKLDRENVEYSMTATNLYYRKYSLYRDEAALNRAMQIARDALQFPGAKETRGPQQWFNRRNRIWLNSFLARCCIEQILDPSEERTDAQKQELLASAEQAVHEIEQLYGSGEEPTVIKWQGMLALAKGNRDVAVRQLVATYEQFKAAGQRDALLAYTLGKLYENSDEVGAAAEFMGNALSIYDRNVSDKIDDSKPEALLDYAALLLKLRAYNMAVSVINYFEDEYWVNSRSKTLRIEAYIGGKLFDEAEKELAKEDAANPNTIELNLSLVRAKASDIRTAIMRRQMEESSDIWQQSMKENAAEASIPQLPTEVNNIVSLEKMSNELDSYTDSSAQLVEKLLAVEPNSVNDSWVVAICEHYISRDRTNEASAVADKYLKSSPKNTNLLTYKKILSEPDPKNIAPQRRNQLEQEVLSDIADPAAKALYLGAFFQRTNEPNKAVEEYKKVLGIIPVKGNATDEAVLGKSNELIELQRTAASSLLDIAMLRKDVKLAEQVADVGRQNKLDNSDGKFFDAVVAFIKQDYRGALTTIDECLKLKPVFSYGFMLRSTINSALGNEHAAIADIRQAASLNPLNGNIAGVLARELYQRNQKLGLHATDEQITELKSAMDRAMALNPNDMQLLGFYAEYISDTEPLRALAIRQLLQKNSPNMENAFLLGKMALKVADKETNHARKEILYAVAVSSLQQALVYEPGNKAVLARLGEYYRVTGQGEKAEELLAQAKEPKLLWRHFIMVGRYNKAKEFLLQLYAEDQNDSDTLKGLSVVSQYLNDQETAKKYSDKLVEVADSSENRLLQIQTLIQTGLVKEAEDKLQSFKEKYPADTRGVQLEGWVAMRQGKLAKAMELINRNLELNQDDAMAWRLRGEINYLMANNDEAVADLKKSKALSDTPDTRISLAKALLRITRGEDALTELEPMLDDPKAPVDGALLLEEIFYKLNKKRSLVNLYNKVLENFPDNLLWYDRAARFALDTNDFNTAVALYEKGWHKSGEQDSVMFDGYLQSLLAAGKADKVIEEAGQYVDSNLAPLALFRIGEVKLKLGNRAEAIQYCHKAIEKTSDDENAATWVLEKMYRLLGPEEVLKVCKERLEANPDSPSANYAMFNVAKFNGQYNKALEYIEKCIKSVEAGNTGETELRLRKVEVLQLAYHKTSDNNYLRSAIAEYESLLTNMPNNANILNNVAYLLADTDERFDQASEYAERAHRLAPNNADFMDTYAYVLYKKGRQLQAAGNEPEAKDKFVKATELLRASIQQHEQNKERVTLEIYEHLGMAQEALGEKVEAIKTYERALEVGANTLSKTENERIKVAIDRLSQ